LQVIGGYSCEEIADALRISSGAVMIRLFRAQPGAYLVVDGQYDLVRVLIMPNEDVEGTVNVVWCCPVRVAAWQ
jgi:hypothetical protein